MPNYYRSKTVTSLITRALFTEGSQAHRYARVIKKNLPLKGKVLSLVKLYLGKTPEIHSEEEPILSMKGRMLSRSGNFQVWEHLEINLITGR